MKSKKGKLAVEYIAVIVIALAVLMVMLLISDKIRTYVVEGIASFFRNIIRRG